MGAGGMLCETEMLITSNSRSDSTTWSNSDDPMEDDDISWMECSGCT